MTYSDRLRAAIKADFEAHLEKRAAEKALAEAEEMERACRRECQAANVRWKEAVVALGEALTAEGL